MKKKLYSLTLALGMLGLSAIIAAGCGSESKGAPEAAPQQQDVQKTPPPPVQLTGKAIKDNGELLQLSLNIPVVGGMENREIQSQINAAFEKYAAERKEAMAKGAGDFAREAKKQGFPFRPYELWIDYKVTYNKSGLLSLYTECYEYTGGAHGLTVRTQYNLSLNTGKEIALGELFREGTDYKGIINQEIARQISAEPNKFFPAGDMGFKTIADNQSFYFEEGGIVIYFGLYEIAPYASGIPEFKIPFALFKEGLNIDLAGQ